TLGCGSWGGNVTSDNVSPIHLLDIKRVAFETKPVSVPSSKFQVPSLSNTKFETNEGQKTKYKTRRNCRDGRQVFAK
ncbi:MAG: hypothetical protein M3Q33_01005, partial [Acidobacteriota bacterium]|nr:hypothetical protein [Acidobacteriota bacterium]